MIVTLKDKTDLVVPPTLQRRLGIKAGDRVEFKVSGGIINIIPKLPSADDDYTSRQRKAIDARLAAAKKGRFHGPFTTADAAIRFLNKEITKRRVSQPQLKVESGGVSSCYATFS